MADQRQTDEDDENAASSGTTKVTTILLGKKGAFYSNQAALVGEALALEGQENGRNLVRKGHGLCSLSPGISLCEKKTKTTATEKKMLHQAGLGCKKIKLLADDTAEVVLDKLINGAKDEYGSTVGFPQLHTCGGFEMLQYLANCRDLTVIWQFVVRSRS